MIRSDPAISPLLRRTLTWTLLVVVAGILLWLLAPVLTPFLVAAIVGYILNPGVDWLARRRVPRWLGTTVMLVVLIAACLLLVLIVVPVLQREFVQARTKLPELLQRLQTSIAPTLSRLFGVDVDFSADAIRSYAAEHFNLEQIGASALAYLRVGGAAALSWLATAFLVPIVLFYLLIDWHMVWARLQVLLPRGLHSRLGAMGGEVDTVLAQFLRGQLLVMLVLACYYSIALSIARFEGALPIGLLTGLLVFVPYVGFASGLLLALLAALLQFGNVYGFVCVAVIYGVGQVLESVFLTPRLVGTNIGLHPLAVIFALLAFGELFGFFGILLALPVSAVLVVAGKHALQALRRQRLLSGPRPRRPAGDRGARPGRRRPPRGTVSASTQLLLELEPAPRPTFDNFVVGRNAEALAAVRRLCRADAGDAAHRFVYVWGAAGSGRSHLLRAACDACGGTYLDRATPAALDATLGSAAQLIAVDDVQATGDDAQVALFHAINVLRARTGADATTALLVAGDAAPRDVALAPGRDDLRSRLAWGLVYRLDELDDDEKDAALVRHAEQRGFPLSADVRRYLLTHFSRDLASLMRTVDALDRHGREQQRVMTVPLIRDYLQARLPEVA